MELRDALPEHAVPDEVRHRPELGVIRIDGCVRHEVTLTPAELAGIKRITFGDPFTCEEGWTVPGLTWSGCAVADVVARALPLQDARYVRVWSGTYSATVPLFDADAGQAVLCDTLDGQPLSLQHGGPWRLIVRGGQCFTSVKWVDRLEVTAVPELGTGEAIARERLRRAQPR